ncbi:hypothetical protein [Pseudolactococcus reticulitermitis]|uniref:LXG domain-containing protein n=1 Tax=Pseudolactococcus reticulitermitis TaxID=2025039 RepID=A0A224XFP9_9LACT|nr:hypothetical protein [Lactococcus reticulitermitis]GAX48371.1 hypothetical protein RsY01_1993 [Lactococcus reticulitermitis]
MGIDMYVSEARTQADSVATRCDSRVKGYENLQKAISDFYFNSQGLSGKTYDSAKEYFMSVLYPLAQGGALLSEATKEAVKRFPEEYTARVDTCDWKESELIENLTQIDQQIRTLYDIRSNIEYYPMPDLIKTTLLYANEEQIQLYQDMHNVFSEKLDRLREFNASSPEIFSEIDALESSIKQGLAQVKSSWNASSGTFMVPQDLSWVATIEKASKVANERKFSDEIERFLKDGGQLMVYKDRAKAKLASQNEFASDVSFEDADVVIWYIVKDGVVINLAEHPEFKDLYKYLQKKGDKLKKDQYKTVSYNQAEKMTVDSMDGIEGRIARFEYYFRPAESALAGVVAGVTTAKAIKATGKVPYGDNGLQSKELEFSGTHFSAETSPSVTAKKWQGKGKYPGIDNYQDVVIKKGSIVYRGEPNGTEYFTTTSAIEEASGFADNLFNGLQVEKHPIFGYRNTMQGYEITSDIRGGISRTIANKQFGNGGSTQLFIPDIDDLIKSGSLKPTSSITLE